MEKKSLHVQFTGKLLFSDADTIIEQLSMAYQKPRQDFEAWFIADTTTRLASNLDYHAAQETAQFFEKLGMEIMLIPAIDNETVNNIPTDSPFTVSLSKTIPTQAINESITSLPNTQSQHSTINTQPIVYASMPKRIVAFLLDSCILIIAINVINLFFPILKELEQIMLQINSFEDLIDKQSLIINSRSGRIIFYLQIIYFVFLSCSPLQGTLGKYICKIKIVNAQSQPINFLQAAIRYSMFFIISIAPFLFFLMLFNKKRQSGYDFIARTYVIERHQSK